eukprot:3576214-Rhodomonas_salina.2
MEIELSVDNASHDAGDEGGGGERARAAAPAASGTAIAIARSISQQAQIPVAENAAAADVFVWFERVHHVVWVV